MAPRLFRQDPTSASLPRRFLCHVCNFVLLGQPEVRTRGIFHPLLTLLYYWHACQGTMSQRVAGITSELPCASDMVCHIATPDPCGNSKCCSVELRHADLQSAALQYKRTKPEPRICPVCSENVGISRQSLAVHVRTKHGPEHEHLLTESGSPKSAG